MPVLLLLHTCIVFFFFSSLEQSKYWHSHFINKSNLKIDIIGYIASYIAGRVGY